MADYNVVIRKRNKDNTDWENIYPITSAENVISSDGNSLESHLTEPNPHKVTVSQIGAETPKGAQGKADKAESNAKTYADQEIGKANKNLTSHLNDNAKHFTAAEKEKLAKIQEGATNYKHPSSHPASIITGLHDVAMSGDYRELRNKPISLPASGGNASTVNGHTVNANVPSDAKFTDTNTHRAISDSVSSTSTSTAASSKAAKTAYDRGSSALSKANSAYSKAEQAFQSASNGKNSVAAAITGMGQSASSGDTFSTLATKIKNISKDANASTSHVLSGKTFYQGGIKRKGTMSNRSGGYNTDSLTRSGNTLKMSIPDAGYYSDGAYVQYKDNDWVESNIKKGVNIFGKVGSLSEGYKCATGEIYITETSCESFFVSGLNFMPSIIYLFEKKRQGSSIYCKDIKRGNIWYGGAWGSSYHSYSVSIDFGSFRFNEYYRKAGDTILWICYGV